MNNSHENKAYVNGSTDKLDSHELKSIKPEQTNSDKANKKEEKKSVSFLALVFTSKKYHFIFKFYINCSYV